MENNTVGKEATPMTIDFEKLENWLKENCQIKEPKVTLIVRHVQHYFTPKSAAASSSTEAPVSVQESRLKEDANTFIDRAIEMLKDCWNDSYNSAGYNGVVSLLQYAKESHAAQLLSANDRNQQLETSLQGASILVVEKTKEGDELKEALRYLVNDVRNKPNDTRYATALKKANDILNK